MKQIRRGVFETNSSTTHSISIIRDHIPKADVPFNQHIILDLDDFLEDYDEGEEVKYITQLGKLGFIINLLTIYIVDELDEQERAKIDTYADLIGLECFEWTEEVIFEVTRSTFEISEKSIKSDKFPFLPYWKFYGFSDSTVLKLFKTIKENNEKDFKTIVRTIIFDDEAVIIEKVHCDGYNWITWYK